MFRNQYNIKTNYGRRKKYSSKAFQNSKLIKYFIFVFFSKVFYFLLIVASLLSINFSVKNNNFDILIKGKIITYSKPIYFLAELPFNTVHSLIYGFKNIITVSELNSSLTKENKILNEKVFESFEVSRENENFKKILNFIDNIKHDYDFVSAKVYSKSKSNINQSMIVNIGYGDGIIENSIALGENGGVIGRVVEVSDHFSNILLLNDINSKIPARVGEYNERIILSGNNERHLEILYFYSKIPVFKDGDLVYTSGDSDLIPDGLLIGTVKFKGNTPIVEMRENINGLFNVVIIKKL